ncbi:MAG TPA: hypothetical protein VGK87_15885, partial [Anaerolineae bacterium]
CWPFARHSRWLARTQGHLPRTDEVNTALTNGNENPTPEMVWGSFLFKVAVNSRQLCRQAKAKQFNHLMQHIRWRLLSHVTVHQTRQTIKVSQINPQIPPDFLCRIGFFESQSIHNVFRCRAYQNQTLTTFLAQTKRTWCPSTDACH